MNSQEYTAYRVSEASSLVFALIQRHRCACLRSERLLIWLWVTGCKCPSRASAMAHMLFNARKLAMRSFDAACIKLTACSSSRKSQ